MIIILMSMVHKYFRILYLGECKHSLLFCVQGAHIFQSTLFRGVQTFIIILMSGDFKATPFVRLFFLHFLKGFSKEIDHLSLVDFFLHPRTFQARFGVWSLLLPAQRVLRASERA